MTYIIEIKLPGSDTWFKYFTGIESREEAWDIKLEAEGKVKARVRKPGPETSLVEDVVETILRGIR